MVVILSNIKVEEEDEEEEEVLVVSAKVRGCVDDGDRRCCCCNNRGENADIGTECGKDVDDEECGGEERGGIVEGAG